MEILIENCKCLSWNEMQKAHFRVRGALRDELKELVMGIVLENRKILKTARSMQEPFAITIEAHFTHGNRRDPDNLYVKPILDGLVQVGMFSDDNGKIIEALTLKAKIKMPSNQIIISIKENL